MSDSPYFQSAGKQIDDSKAALLQAVAQAGTQGKAAFDAAQAQIAQQKQDAVARAAQRSALGVGGNNDTFLSSYDARAGQLGSNQAGFQSGLDQTAASGQSYLEKARGGMGALEAVNINKGQDAEMKIRLAIQAAQAKAQAAAQAQAAQDARANATAARADARSQASSDRADARAAATNSAKLPTADQLFGQGKAIADKVNPMLKPSSKMGETTDVDNAVFLANQLGGVGPNGVDAQAAARAYAKNLGLDEGTINGIITPAKSNSYTKAVTPIPTPDEKWLTSNVRGMDATKAKQALSAPEFQQAGSLASMLAGATINPDGTLAGTDPGMDPAWAGLTPRQALVKWIGTQPGNLSMKAAVDQYYGTQLDQFTKK